MNRVAMWVNDHQLTSFFLLTFLITWGLGFSYGAVMKEGKMLLAPLVFLATCGPALAGIIITIVTDSHSPSGTRRTAWIVFVAVWLLTVIVFLAHFAFINGSPLSPTLIGVITVTVVPVAFITSVTYTRFPLPRRFQAIPPIARGALPWILVAVFLIPVLSLVSVVISPLLGRSSVPFAQVPAAGITLVGWLAVKFLYQFFFFNATGEEAGWRGFALPRLQARVSPLIAGVVLTLFWVPWHLMLWQAEGRPVDTFSYWLMSYAIHLPAGVIICWLFNRSGGSVLVAGIAHAAANTGLALIGNLDPLMLALPLYGFVVVIVVVDRMWRTLPEDHPAVHQKSGHAVESAFAG